MLHMLFRVFSYIFFFRPLKATWRDDVLQWRLENNGAKLKRENFAKLLEKTFPKIDMKQYLQSGFRSTRLYPFDANAINFKKYFKTSTDKEPVTTENTSTGSLFSKEKIQAALDILESTIDDKMVEEFEEFEKQGHWSGDVKFEADFPQLVKDKTNVE